MARSGLERAVRDSASAVPAPFLSTAIARSEIYSVTHSVPRPFLLPLQPCLGTAEGWTVEKSVVFSVLWPCWTVHGNGEGTGFSWSLSRLLSKAVPGHGHETVCKTHCAALLYSAVR